MSGSGKGIKRDENQDRVMTAFLDENTALAVLCDGMGGQNAGSEASSTAIEIIADVIQRGYSSCRSTDDIYELVNSAIIAANDLIFDISSKDNDKFGMGTTCVVAVIRPGRAYIANVGDSRGYLLSDGRLIQITTDHSVVRAMVERGEITEEQAKSHPRRNYITRAIGVVRELNIDFFDVDDIEFTAVMLCSDGLSGFTEMRAVEERLCSPDDSGGLIDSLIELARQSGSTDDTTVAIVMV